MTQYIHISSSDRDLTTFPNASNFSILAAETRDWPNNPKIVNIIPPSLYNQPFNFLSSVKLNMITATFIWTIGSAELPPIFLNIVFDNANSQNVNLILSSNNKDRNVTFIAPICRMHDYSTATDKIIKCTYYCDMCQIMRFVVNGTFNVSIMDENRLDLSSLDRIDFVTEILPLALDGKFNLPLTQYRNL